VTVLTKKNKVNKNKAARTAIKKNISNVPSRRCLVSALIAAVFVIVLLALRDDIDTTLFLWEHSWALTASAVILLGLSVFFKIKVKSSGTSESSLIFSPNMAIAASSVFLFWTLVFMFTADRTTPLFIAALFAFIVLYFIYVNLDRAFFIFSLYTVACAGLIWVSGIFGLIGLSLKGIICAVGIFLLTAALPVFILISKKGNAKGGVFAEVYSSSIVPFIITFAISVISIAVSLIMAGLEIYFAMAQLIWFIVFGVIKAVKILEA